MINQQFKYKLIEIVHYFKEWLFRFRYLNIFSYDARTTPIGIAMIDGRKWHGGMCDRFKGIISLYNYCLTKNIPFKIYYNYPFNLSEYLLPNEYNWEIDETELPKSIWNVRPFIAIAETGRRLLKLDTKKSIWYYGNRDLGLYIKEFPFNTQWGVTFKKLFKLSPLLEEAFNQTREQIKGDYVAVVYRFQNLLGDFDEYNFKSIQDNTYKQSLIARAIEELENIRKIHPDKTILVTSDSISFLKKVEKFNYTFIIPGKIEHMDTTENDQKHVQLKSFLDFFMISESKAVYSVVINEMYKSEFPEYAAKINNIPFKRLIYTI